MSTEPGKRHTDDHRPDTVHRDDSSAPGAEIGIEDDGGTTFEPEEDPDGAADS